MTPIEQAYVVKIILVVMFIGFGLMVTMIIHENASNIDGWHRAWTEWRRGSKRQVSKREKS